jgi:hypothetical protein
MNARDLEKKIMDDPKWAFANLGVKSIHHSMKVVDGDVVASRFRFTFLQNGTGWDIEIGEWESEAKWSRPVAISVGDFNKAFDNFADTADLDGFVNEILEAA